MANWRDMLLHSGYSHLKPDIVQVGELSGSRLFAPTGKSLNEITQRVLSSDPGQYTGAAVIQYHISTMTPTEALALNGTTALLIDAKKYGNTSLETNNLQSRVLNKIQPDGVIGPFTTNLISPASNWHQDGKTPLSSFLYLPKKGFLKGAFKIGAFKPLQISVKRYKPPYGKPYKELIVPISKRYYTQIVFDGKNLYHRGGPVKIHPLNDAVPVQTIRNAAGRITKLDKPSNQQKMIVPHPTWVDAETHLTPYLDMIDSRWSHLAKPFTDALEATYQRVNNREYIFDNVI